MNNTDTGITCPCCYIDIGNDKNHMCGNDPIVQADEKTLMPVPGSTYGFRCKYCYSGVGRQHYNCPKATDTHRPLLAYYISTIKLNCWFLWIKLTNKLKRRLQ